MLDRLRRFRITDGQEILIFKAPWPPPGSTQLFNWYQGPFPRE